jgi:capsular polysaccharide biosynthesis protein
VPPELHRALSGEVFAWRPRRLRGRSALVGAIGHRNFYHWMFDTLPRIGLVRDAGLESVERWIVPASDLPVARALLARAGLDASRLEPLRRADHVVCDELVVTSAPGEVCEPTPRAVAFLRGTLAVDRARVPGKRVHIARRGRRKIANEAELAPALERFGFRTVAMEGLSLDEQIAAVAGAEAVVAPHGAALAHLIHAADGATLVELMPPSYPNPSFFVLAGACGLRYAAVQGDGDATNAAASGARDFTVDRVKFERALAAAFACI